MPAPKSIIPCLDVRDDAAPLVQNREAIDAGA